MDGFDNSAYKKERLKAINGAIISDRSYNLVIGGMLLWGIVINVLMAVFLTNTILRMNPILVLVLYVAGTLGCTFVVYKSTSPVISFAGFSGLAACMGLVLCFFIAEYQLGTVSLAFQMTAIITVAMMILATLFPGFFMSIGRSLGLALILSIVVELVAGFIFKANLQIMDYVIVIIFCGYIGFDWAKAQIYPKTLDNAIDSAADIYVDVVNIFIRLLIIFGKRDD